MERQKAEGIKIFNDMMKEEEKDPQESLKKAKAKYVRSDKGKACAQRSYEKNKEQRVLNERRNRKIRKEKNEMQKLFYETYKHLHTEFKPVLNTEPV